MTAVKQPAPQKRESLAILSAARPFLTTAAEITIRGHRIQPWLSSTTTRNARRWSPPTHQQDPTATPCACFRGAFAPKPLLAQKRPSPAAGRAQIVPYARHARRSRAYSPASLSASSPRAAARSSGLCSRSRAAHAIALLVTSRQRRPFSEIANSRNSGVCPEIFFSGRIVPNQNHP